MPLKIKNKVAEGLLSEVLIRKKKHYVIKIDE
jgi:hypothetical protein